MAEIDDKTIVSRLRQYVAEYQSSSDIIFQALLYTYNTQVHQSAGVSQFSLRLPRYISAATELRIPSPVGLDISGKVSPHILRSRLLARPALVKEKFKSLLTASEQRCSSDYNIDVLKPLLFKSKGATICRHATTPG